MLLIGRYAHVARFCVWDVAVKQNLDFLSNFFYHNTLWSDRDAVEQEIYTFTGITERYASQIGSGVSKMGSI